MIDLSNLENYIAYFEALATGNKIIAHTPQRKSFFMIDDVDDYQEVLESLSTVAKFPCLALEFPNISLGDVSGSDNQQMQHFGAFLVLYKKLNPTAKEKRDLANNSLIVATQLYFKMKKDRQSGHLLNFNGALQNGLKVTIVPEFHGYRFTFNIGSHLPGSYNANDWL